MLPLIAALALMTATSARPLVVAHRGASADAPENTLAAFELAWKQGADAIEGDFRLTRDQQVACIHDANTRRVAARSLKVDKTRLAELKTLDVGAWKDSKFAGARIPTLAQVIATVPPGKLLYIELKSGPKVIRPFLDAIDASRVDPAQLVVITFSARTVTQLKGLRPELTVYWITDIRRRGKSPRLQPSTQRILATLARCRADGLSAYAHPELGAPFATAIRDAGYPLNLWTVNDAKTAQKWTDLGVHSLTTNVPALLLER